MKLEIDIKNPCLHKKEFCSNCYSHFMMIRPLVKNVVVHRHFIRDLGKDEKMVNSIIRNILDCSHMEFHELHKFEKNIKGILIFRAKREGIHYLYGVHTKNVETILFLRAIKNFTKYKKLLSDRKKLRKMTLEING